ncbi:hypothetical protein CHUAL_006687 [Chamberlinius hualienensis]
MWRTALAAQAGVEPKLDSQSRKSLLPVKLKGEFSHTPLRFDTSKWWNAFSSCIPVKGEHEDCTVKSEDLKLVNTKQFSCGVEKTIIKLENRAHHIVQLLQLFNKVVFVLL